MDILNLFNGGAALILVCVAWFFIIIGLYYYFKKDSKIHIFSVLFCTAVAFGWTGISITFLSVAIHGYNLDGVESIISYFSYSTIPLGATTVVAMNWDVFGSPKKKKHIVIIFLISAVIYYIVLFSTFHEAIIVSEPVPGVVLDDWVSPTSFFYYILWAQVTIPAIVTGLGFNKFRRATAGDLTNRAKYIMIASILGGGGILLDTVILMGTIIEGILWVPRIMMIFALIFIHLGYRPSKG